MLPKSVHVSGTEVLVYSIPKPLPYGWPNWGSAMEITCTAVPDESLVVVIHSHFLRLFLFGLTAGAAAATGVASTAFK